MEFQRKSSSHSNVKLTNGRDRGKYLHNLQLYCIPPNENISLQEFEELAVERLKSKLLSLIIYNYNFKCYILLLTNTLRVILLELVNYM